MNGVVAATKESQNGMASPPTLPDVVNGDAGLTSFEEEEKAELEQEVQDLKEDRTYHDFITNVVEHKEIAEEDEKLDSDFVVEVEQPAVVDDKLEQDGAESDSSSTLTDFEDAEDGEEKAVVPCSDGLETKIPKEALREAEKRFPHFWRTKHAMKTEYREGDYEEEQDPDYEPEKDKEAVDLDDTQDEETVEAALENSGNAGGEDWRQAEEVELDSDHDKEEFEEEEEDPEAMKAELNELQAEKEKDLKGEVDGLVEMVEYMTVVVPDNSSAEAAVPESGSVGSPVSSPVAVADTAASDAKVVEEVDDNGEADDEGEDMEDDMASQTIGELELDGYVSAEDPDFPEPSREDFDAASDSHPDTDDEMTVERME